MSLCLSFLCVFLVTDVHLIVSWLALVTPFRCYPFQIFVLLLVLSLFETFDAVAELVPVFIRLSYSCFVSACSLCIAPVSFVDDAVPWALFVTSAFCLV